MITGGSRIWIALIIGLGLLVYSNIYKNEFLFDDLPVIVENESVKDFRDLSEIFLTSSWTSKNEADNFRGYRPFTTLSFAINYAFHGMSLAGYHLIDVLIHIANSLIIYGLFFTLFQRRLLAGIIAVLFVTHPVNTEAVAGLFARADELAAFFVLLALWSYIKVWQNNLKKGLFFLCLSSLCFVAGMASKESAVCFVLLAIVYEVCFNFVPKDKIASTDKRLILAKGAVLIFFLLLALGYMLGWRPFITGQFGDQVIAEGFRPPGLLHNWPIIWRVTAFKAFAYYMKLLFWPVVLSGDYLYNQIPLTNQISDPLVLTGIITFFGFLFLGIWALVKGYVGVAFGIFFFYAAYAPISNLAFPIGVLVGERLIYLPSLGFCIVVAFLFEHLFVFLKRKTTLKKAGAILSCALAVVVMGYGARAFARNFDWKNPYVFFKKTSMTSPNSAVSHYSTAVAYLTMVEDNRYIERWMTPREILELKTKDDKGKSFLIENGLKSISTALDITKGYPNFKYLNVYGALLAMAGRLEQAKNVLSDVIQRAPGLIEAKVTLAAVYMKMASMVGKKETQSSELARRYLTESVKCLQEVGGNNAVLSRRPIRLAEIYFNLSIAQEKLGNYDEALGSSDNAFLWLNRAMESMGERQLLLGRFYVIRASILADRMDYEGAIDALAKAKQAGFPNFRRYALKMKQLRPLHGHPKFADLVKPE